MVKKCEASGIYVKGSLLKEGAINIKQSLSLRELDGFKGSESCLDKWKLSHSMKEKTIYASLLVSLKLRWSLGWSK